MSLQCLVVAIVPCLTDPVLPKCRRADDLRASGAFAEMRANLPEGCNLTTLEEALAKSDGSAARMVVPGRDGHPKNPLINLTYTSGSSGRPKGAEYRERVYVEFLQVRVLLQHAVACWAKIPSILW